MDLSTAFKSMTDKTPAEVKADYLNLCSAMTPERFLEHTKNIQYMASESGRENEREEIVCRLLASGMTVDEIAVILCARVENIRIIESNNAAIKIPQYAKKLKERQRRREKQKNKQVQPEQCGDL